MKTATSRSRTADWTPESVVGLPGPAEFARLLPGQWLMKSEWDELWPSEKAYVAEMLSRRGLGLVLNSDEQTGRYLVVDTKRLRVEAVVLEFFIHHDALSADQKAEVIRMTSRHSQEFVDEFDPRHFVHSMTDDGMAVTMARKIGDVVKSAIATVSTHPRHLLRVGRAA